MTGLEWFEDEFKMAGNFMSEVLPLVCSVEAHRNELMRLEEERTELEKKPGKSYYQQAKLQALVHTMESLQKENRVKLEELVSIKKNYLAEDFIGALETLTSAEDGDEISEEACTLMKRATDLIREAGLEEY